MIGALAGDIIGSVYEWEATKSKTFPLFGPDSKFTDDSVLTVAVADVLLHRGDYTSAFRDYYQRYRDAGYGMRFHMWASSADTRPYGSYGNGSAMRVSPVAFAFDELSQVLAEAKRSADATHNHPEGVKGAQAVAAAILLARKGRSKTDIRQYIEESFSYHLHVQLDVIRPAYSFDETCQGSVPQAIISFLESTDFEDAIRNAVSLGGDADTQACIAGAIAHAFYGVPQHIEAEVMRRLTPDLKLITQEFASTYLTAAPPPR
jgi:ADP-ribosylglycohydrolase